MDYRDAVAPRDPLGTLASKAAKGDVVFQGSEEALGPVGSLGPQASRAARARRASQALEVATGNRVDRVEEVRRANRESSAETDPQETKGCQGTAFPV